jgi:hypothetical protein
MNPDKNEFEKLQNKEATKEFCERFYSREDKAGSDIPIFTIGEEITIKGYIFRVQQISKRRLAFRPVRKTRK